MEDTCVLNSFSGVSSGTSTYGEEIRDAVDAREFSVWMEDLWDTAADVRDDRAVDTRPGILKFLNLVYRMGLVCNRSERDGREVVEEFVHCSFPSVICTRLLTQQRVLLSDRR
jgi:hypothetical protein